MSTLTTGTVVDKRPTPVVKERSQRKVELYKGDIPSNSDGKTPQTFSIKEKCGVSDDGKKCVQQLLVHVIKNTRFERDESGFGGQLIYDEKDTRAYLTCPKHGPWDVPEKW